MAKLESYGDGLVRIAIEQMNTGKASCDGDGDGDGPEYNSVFLFDSRTRRFLVAVNHMKEKDALEVKGDVVTATECGKPAKHSVAALRKASGWEAPPKSVTFATGVKSLVNQGRGFTGKKHYALALQAYQKALALDGKHAGAMAALDYAQLRANALADAEETLQKALTLKRDAKFQGIVWYNLGLVRSGQGQVAAAKKAFEKSHALRPTKAKKKKLRL